MLGDNTASNFVHDSCTYLVEEIMDSERGFAQGPERALMSALLFDGVQTYMHYATSENESQKTRFKEAYNWIASKSKEYIFSFENVCEGLGIDPDYLRYGLVNATNSQKIECRKSRRTY